MKRVKSRLIVGGCPKYFVPGAPDDEVLGLCLSARGIDRFDAGLVKAATAEVASDKELWWLTDRPETLISRAVIAKPGESYRFYDALLPRPVRVQKCVSAVDQILQIIALLQSPESDFERVDNLSFELPWSVLPEQFRAAVPALMKGDECIPAIDRVCADLGVGSYTVPCADWVTRERCEFLRSRYRSYRLSETWGHVFMR